MEWSASKPLGQWSSMLELREKYEAVASLTAGGIRGIWLKCWREE